jgi:hypothetical protein
MVAAFLPAAFVVVFLGITACWAATSPFIGYLVLFPSIVPLAMLEMPGMTATSPTLIFTGAIFVGLIFRPGRARRLVAAVPPYALIGALGLLAVETASAVHSPAPTAATALVVRMTRTFQLLLAVALAGQPDGLRVSGRGWMLFGLLEVLAAFHFRSAQVGVTAIRGGVVMGLASVDGITALVANVGYAAVGSAWFWFASSSRSRGVKQVAYLAVGGLCLASAFYSGRRQAILATLIAIALAALTVRKAKAAVGLAAAGVLILVLYSYGPLGELIAERGTPFSEFGGQKNTGYLLIHEAGLKAFLGSPILGIGLGNYVSATRAEMVGAGGGEWSAAHSSVVRVLAETGVLGGVALTILLGGFLIALVRAVLRRQKQDRAWSLQSALPAFSVVLTGVAVTLLESQDYNFLLGQAIGLLYWDQCADGTSEMSSSTSLSHGREKMQRTAEGHSRD